MKNQILNKLSLLIVAAILLTACDKKKEDNSDKNLDAKKEEVSQEGTKKMIFENDYAKVLKVTLEPNESLALHNGEERLIYSLSDYSINWTEEGNSGVKAWKEGDVHFHSTGEHAAENTGSVTAEWLVFIKKEAELPDCGENTLDNDVNSVASDFAEKSFDNDMFRVTEVTLPVGESIPMHSGVNRMIYSLTDYKLIYESNIEEKGEKKFNTGDLHWHKACSHALKNNGKTEAKFLVVAYKK